MALEEHHKWDGIHGINLDAILMRILLEKQLMPSIPVDY
jgi:hypothetical protein